MSDDAKDFEALLIDYGGVLTTSMRAWLDESCAAVGADVDRFLAAVAAISPSPFELVEAGRISKDEFADLITPALVASAGPEAMPTGRAWLSSIQISDRYLDMDMVRLVDTIRAEGATVVLVSNSWGPEEEYPWAFLPTFDAVVVSGTIGIRKPDRGIYEAALRAAGVRADRCVFVDDTAENLVPASDLGMLTIHHVDPADTRHRLASLFLAGSSG